MTNATGASGYPFMGESAINLLQNNVFPAAWHFVPVSGKKTFVKQWATQPLTKEQCIEAYRANRAYNGIGVVTGNFSDGLIALDIDGPLADARYRAMAGDEYEPYGEEKTMAWTSGKEGRRQVLYRLPSQIHPELAEVKTLILRYDGEWYSGQGDKDRVTRDDVAPDGEEYQEVVLRFNNCQSVLPGSSHPEGRRYKFLAYNEGMPAKAPGWVMDALRPYRKPVRFLSDEMVESLKDFSDTIIPPRQIRGWFFKEEIQAKLMPRLAELVFNHAAFDTYGWKESGGANPQMKSGCPWHGGKSGTSFSFATESGCWDCKACGVHGDLLDFVHKIRSNNKNAPKPNGVDLENYVADITTALGYNYPEDARAQVIKEVPRLLLDEVAFHEALIRINDEEMNPAIRSGRMAGLAAETGRRLTGTQCLAAMDEYRYYKRAKEKNDNSNWWENVERMDFLVPNLLMRPTQVMLHAAGGLGKTSACMGLAKAVGRGESMRIRGIDLPVKKGTVLWIQNDQNPAKLLRDCEDNGINPALDKWFIVKRGWQLNHEQEMVAWIKAYKPALVVVDSIGSCSTQMQIEEKDKAFAHPLYYYADKNGDPSDGGFPATTIIWIHHDNANGEARGTRYLINAIDEQWHLRPTTDDEREAIRERGSNPSNCRMIAIRKSRLGRQGDLLVVERDENFSYSVADYTPTERREDNGQGAPEPNTMALRIVKDRVKEASEEGVTLRDRMTAKEVWERLVEELNGQVRKSPSVKTVRRWLDRWVEDGVLVEGAKVKVEGVRVPVQTYTLPTTSSCALPSKACPLSLVPRERLQEQEIKRDNSPSLEDDVPRSEYAQPVPNQEGHRSNPEQDVPLDFPVVPTDLEERGTKDTFKQGKKDPHGQRAPVQAIADPASEVDESGGQDRPLGAEVPNGEDPDRPVLGDEPSPAVGDGGSPDHSDVVEPGPRVPPHARRELGYYTGPEDDYSGLEPD